MNTLKLFSKIRGCLIHRTTTGILRFSFKQMLEYYHHKANSRNGNRLDICCSVHTEGANFSNPEGYTSLRVIASPSLNQDQLWRLFDLVPGLDFLHLDTKSRLVRTVLTARHIFVSFSIELCLRLHTHWKSFEYNRIVWFMELVRQSLFVEAQVCDYAKRTLLCCRLSLKRDGTRWRTGGEVKGKLVNVVGSQSPSHRLTLLQNLVYPPLLLLMCTPLLPVVDWTDASTDFSGLIRFVERRNLVSTRVPSHFKRSLTLNHRTCAALHCNALFYWLPCL